MTNQSNSSNASQAGTRDDTRAGPQAAEPAAPDPEANAAPARTVPVAVAPPPAARLANPLLQALWRQAHGATLPLPGELENRAALLATIRAHVAPQESPPPA